MCGRYGFFMPLEQAAALLDVAIAPNDDWQPRYNAAPTQPMPVITNEFPGVIQFLRWGLVPSWAKDPFIGSKMINTRIESIEEKASFRNIAKYKRCIVLANGYYEWKATTTSKKTGQPYFIRAPEQPLLLMAGIWSHWGLQGLQTYSIVTRPANEAMQALHSRMPILFSKEGALHWLSKGAAANWMELMQQNTGPALSPEPVSNLVNKVNNEGPELIQQACAPVVSQGTLF